MPDRTVLLDTIKIAGLSVSICIIVAAEAACAVTEYGINMQIAVLALYVPPLAAIGVASTMIYQAYRNRP